MVAAGQLLHNDISPSYSAVGAEIFVYGSVAALILAHVALSIAFKT